jgi:hypothetical protein
MKVNSQAQPAKAVVGAIGQSWICIATVRLNWSRAAGTNRPEIARRRREVSPLSGEYSDWSGKARYAINSDYNAVFHTALAGAGFIGMIASAFANAEESWPAWKLAKREIKFNQPRSRAVGKTSASCGCAKNFCVRTIAGGETDGW